MGHTIFKECKWYKRLDTSLGEIDWCTAFDEELILDANDCETTECENHRRGLLL